MPGPEEPLETAYFHSDSNSWAVPSLGCFSRTRFTLRCHSETSEGWQCCPPSSHTNGLGFSLCYYGNPSCLQGPCLRFHTSFQERHAAASKWVFIFQDGKGSMGPSSRPGFTLLPNKPLFSQHSATESESSHPSCSGKLGKQPDERTASPEFLCFYLSTPGEMTASSKDGPILPEQGTAVSICAGGTFRSIEEIAGVAADGPKSRCVWGCVKEMEALPKQTTRHQPWKTRAKFY